MKKLFLLPIIALSVGCNNGHHFIKDRWQKENTSICDNRHTSFDEANRIQGSRHGKEVRITGRLVYEFDETAIFPIYEFSEFKPVWIDLMSVDSTLHHFLLKHDGAFIKAVGKLDTIPMYYDSYFYQCAIKDISCVEISKFEKKHEENSPEN